MGTQRWNFPFPVLSRKPGWEGVEDGGEGTVVEGTVVGGRWWRGRWWPLLLAADVLLLTLVEASH